jgi:hypothetical protein
VAENRGPEAGFFHHFGLPFTSFLVYLTPPVTHTVKWQITE